MPKKISQRNKKRAKPKESLTGWKASAYWWRNSKKYKALQSRNDGAADKQNFYINYGRNTYVKEKNN